METILDQIEGNKCYLIAIFFLICLFYMIPAMQNFSSIFTTGSQSVECSLNGEEWHTFTDCTAWNARNASLALCSNQTYSRQQFHETVQSRYSIDCDNQHIPAATVSIYMAGFLLGSFAYGLLSDSRGRVFAILVCCCQITVSCAVGPFLPNIWLYAAARFSVGVGASGVLSASYTFLVENTPPKRRSLLGVLVNFGWVAGQIWLCLLAYLLPDFRWLEVAEAALGLSGMVLFFFPPESIRWQMMHRRREQWQVSLYKIASCSGVSRTEVDTLLDNHHSSLSEREVLLLQQAEDKIPSSSPSQSKLLLEKSGNSWPLWQLFTHPSLRMHAIVVFFDFFVTSMVYYGLSLGVGDLAGNLIFNTLIGAVMEIISTLVTAVASNHFGRVPLLSLGFILSGGACLLSAMLRSFSTSPGVELSVTCLCMTGRLFVNSVFALCYLYSSEIFPTCARNIGLGTASTCARIGSIIVPQIALLRQYWSTLPMYIYGVCPLLAGVLSFCVLTETRNKPLMDQIKDAEAHLVQLKKAPKLVLEVPESSREAVDHK